MRSSRTAGIAAQSNHLAILHGQVLRSKGNITVVQFLVDLTLAYLLPYLFAERVEMSIHRREPQVWMLHVECQPIAVGIDAHAPHITVRKGIDRMPDGLVGLEVQAAMKMVGA